MKKSFVRPALTALLTLAVAAMLVLCAWTFTSPEITEEAKEQHQEMLQKTSADEPAAGGESADEPVEDDPWADMPW